MNKTPKNNTLPFHRHDEIRSKERIAEACKEHTAFEADDFEDDRNLVVLKTGTEICFNTYDLPWQPRSFSLDEKTVKQYVNSCDGVKVGTNTVLGIRETIDVTHCPLAGRPRFLGLRGHHRFAAAEKKKYNYIICKIHPDFSKWSSENQIDFLNVDNAHNQNGLQLKDVCIKASFAQLLGSLDFMPQIRDEIKNLQDLIEKSASKPEIKEHKKQQHSLQLKIRKRLVTLSRGWGAKNSVRKLRGLATEAYRSWSSDDVTKLYVHQEEEFEKIINKATNNLPPEERYHSSKATVASGAVPIKALNWGFVTKSIDYKDREGKPLSAFHFYISIPGASSIHNLFNLRKTVATQLKKYCRGPDLIELKFHFLGQVRTPDSDYIEDPEAIYDLAYVEKKLKQLNQSK